MPEEINRLVTDAVSDLLFTTCRDADENLRREGIEARKIHFVGNVMIDSLMFYAPRADRSDGLERFHLAPGAYGLVTLHRPSNVDDPGRLAELIGALERIAERCPLIFPIHPRTRKMLDGVAWRPRSERLRLVDPLGYLDFLKLMKHARLVLTDSGGIQEETTVLGVPCLTIRENTERPVTIREGTNRLAGCRAERVLEEALRILDGDVPRGRIPELWDGRASERIVAILDDFLK
jgi:UDP-N-acetylglucosamine 2-epimerase (non-hydrolysing)